MLVSSPQYVYKHQASAATGSTIDIDDDVRGPPDPVIWQVLSHAPAKEAVCTGGLSRPWRSLWLSSGVLNLDSRSYRSGPLPYNQSLVFFRDANAALRAVAEAEGSGLRKLTFTYLGPYDDENTFHSRWITDNKLDTLLTEAPAVRGLEELHVHLSPPEFYSLCVAALPSDALRALRFDGLRLEPPQDAQRPSFARLETLRLRQCVVLLTELQAIVDAAPLLAALELDHVHLSSSGAGTGLRQLRCPRVTALSLCNLRGWVCRLAIDVPSLQRFAYRGFVERVSLVSPPPASMARADLHFDLDVFISGRKKDEACQLFWQLVGSFSGAEVLNVSFEQPGARRAAEQLKKMKDAVPLKL